MKAITAAVLAVLPLARAIPSAELAVRSTLALQPRASNSTTCVTSNGDDPSSFSPALYTESTRPQTLFSPSSGFMNDPCGLVRSGDTWHLYYQYNPTENVAGNQHWGHASSKDLYTWQNHPPAISPQNGEGIFTGSAVLDVNNTSGFFNDSTAPENRFVAIYTLNTPTDQNQNVAYSTDGNNYTNYEKNPVISLNTTQFRDPQVFFDNRISKWVMTVAHPTDFQVGFYLSSDLKNWTESSRFGPAGLLGYQYECPNMFRVPIVGGEKDGQMMWVLIVSINPGAPLGGSAVEYFLGDWDGKNFTAADPVARIADFGKDFYATQIFSNGPVGQAIGIGWASNWAYTNVVPTSPFRNSQSTPREFTVRWTELAPGTSGYQLAMQPYNFETLPSTTLDNSTSSSNKTVDLTGDGAFQIRANFSIPKTALTNATNPTGEFKIYDSNKRGFLKIGFTFGTPIVLYVDRRFAGRTFADDNPFFTDRFSQQMAPIYRTPNDTSSDQIMEMRIIVDRTVTEVFAQQGIASALVLTYWDDDSRPGSVSVGVGNDTVKIDSLLIESIAGTWPTCP